MSAKVLISWFIHFIKNVDLWTLSSGHCLWRDIYRWQEMCFETGGNIRLGTLVTIIMQQNDNLCKATSVSYLFFCTAVEYMGPGLVLWATKGNVRKLKEQLPFVLWKPISINFKGLYLWNMIFIVENSQVKNCQISRLGEFRKIGYIVCLAFFCK